jgi:hypothetical protein
MLAMIASGTFSNVPMAWSQMFEGSGERIYEPKAAPRPR